MMMEQRMPTLLGWNAIRAQLAPARASFRAVFLERSAVQDCRTFIA